MKEEEEDLTNPENVPMEDGRKIIMAGSEKSNNGCKTATFEENGTVEFPVTFPPKLPSPGSFYIPCIVGKLEVERALCDLGASVSIRPNCLFHKLHLGLLLAVPFSLQLADGLVMQPTGKLDNVPINMEDIWELEDFIIVDMPETDGAQTILGGPILVTTDCHSDVREGRISFEV